MKKKKIAFLLKQVSSIKSESNFIKQIDKFSGQINECVNGKQIVDCLTKFWKTREEALQVGRLMLNQ